jgi:hypothetical protein
LKTRASVLSILVGIPHESHAKFEELLALCDSFITANASFHGTTFLLLSGQGIIAVRALFLSFVLVAIFCYSTLKLFCELLHFGMQGFGSDVFIALILRCMQRFYLSRKTTSTRSAV